MTVEESFDLPGSASGGTLGTRAGATVEVGIVAVADGRATRRFDRLATEEPLEIRLRAGGAQRTVAVTMRTPGHDFELAAGFLHTEGVVTAAGEVGGMSYCRRGETDAAQQYNIVTVDLTGPTLPVLDALERHFTTTSACGVCGKAHVEALRTRGLAAIHDDVRIPAETIIALPERLRGRQSVFAKTGGLHAAALFDEDGTLLAAREDVGRHNAVDKLIGWAFLDRRLPLRRCILMVSGRSSFEILQKAVAAKIPIVCAVSAPSSLAVALAAEFGVTLAGFVRHARFNVYTHAERIIGCEP